MNETTTDESTDVVTTLSEQETDPFASSDVDTDDIYEAKYDVEIGTTVVADEANGSQQVMWRAEIVWTAEDTAMTEAQYLAEHPAEAILGVIEQSGGGVV
jgi:hypothetical protein